MDLIDRKQAIEALAELPYGIRGMVKGIIADVPSAQPEQRWIPCSERLPGKDGRYLVCGAKGGIYHVNLRDGRFWCQVGCGGKLVPSVIAWMPLPEPYHREGGEE